MIHGENVILSIDNKQVAAAKSCELDVNQNFIQVCSPVSGRWDSFVPSTIGWTASVDMLVVSMANPQAWLNEMKQSATPLTMRYYDTELGIYQVGQCWIASWKNGATVGSISTFSLQLQGTGELRDGEEWVNISAQCTVDDSKLDDESELQQTYSIMPNQIVLYQDPHVEDSVAVFATYISSVGGIGQIGYEIWNIQDIGPVSSERIITQTNPKIVKIYLTDEQDYGYIIVLPDIPTGRQIKVTTISEFQQDNTLQIVAKIYMRSI